MEPKHILTDFEKELKKQLELKPEQLTIEYIKEQNVRLQTQQELEELERNIRKSEFPVLLLGDNDSSEKPSQFLENLQKEIWLEFGFRCALGSHLYILHRGKFEKDIEHEMFENQDYPRLIILVSGKGFGTIRESKLITLRDELNSKTLFFFDHYGNYDQLVAWAKKKQFPIEFKYPIPFTGKEELRAKILFGLLHWFYRYWKYKRKETLNENNK